jgi:hypothetical protein
MCTYACYSNPWGGSKLLKHYDPLTFCFFLLHLRFSVKFLKEVFSPLCFVFKAWRKYPREGRLTRFVNKTQRQWLRNYMLVVYLIPLAKAN